MATLSEEMAKFTMELQFEQVPQEVIEKCKLHMIDIVGISLASSQFNFPCRNQCSSPGQKWVQRAQDNEKFFSNASKAISREGGEQIVRTVEKFNRLPRLTPLMSKLKISRPRTI